MAKDVWDEVWKGAEKSYSEKAITQNQVFEYVKIQTLSKMFPSGKFKMLEVGCGTANVSLYFAKRGAEVSALDTNKNILEVAKANFKSQDATGKFVVGDAEKLPFADHSFDVVCSFGLLEHFKDPTLTISEMTRVLKPEGLFFADIVPRRFSCQTLGNIFNFFASLLFWTLKGSRKEGWRKGIRNFRPLYFENSISWQEYKKIIEDAGIKNVEVRGNRPFPRLTLPTILDRYYARVIKLFRPVWRWFDSYGGAFARIWGAGWWFWGYK